MDKGLAHRDELDGRLGRHREHIDEVSAELKADFVKRLQVIVKDHDDLVTCTNASVHQLHDRLDRHRKHIDSALDQINALDRVCARV